MSYQGEKYWCHHTVIFNVRYKTKKKNYKENSLGSKCNNQNQNPVLRS